MHKDTENVAADPNTSSQVAALQANMVIVKTPLTEDGSTRNVHISIPADHPLSETLPTIPGMYWDGKERKYVAELTRRTALALRAALTGWKPAIDPDSRHFLSATADSLATPDITLGVDKTGVATLWVKFEHSNERRDDIKRLCRGRWDGDVKAWTVPVTQIGALTTFAENHNLVMDIQSRELSEKTREPFSYDGTIEGLRGVPLRELATVRDNPKRGKTESLEKRLNSFGIHNVSDLINHVPHRYLDRSAQIPLSKATVGEDVGFLGRVAEVSSRVQKRMRIVKISVTDGSAFVELTYFNTPWMAHKFKKGDEVAVHGRLDVWRGSGVIRKLQMSNPLIELVGGMKSLIIPVYPQSEKAKVSSQELHACSVEAVARLGELVDPLPTELKNKLTLPDRGTAYRTVHKPNAVDDIETAKRRLAFDELYRMQLALGLRRGKTQQTSGVQHQLTGELTGEVLKQLPFQLTGAQKNALKEIKADLLRPHPMHRLLQGDVGSGKAQPLYSKVLTPNGWATMGDMKVGSIVCTPAGGTATVTGVYPQGVKQKIYRVHLDDGSYADCDENHLWTVTEAPVKPRTKAGTRWVPQQPTVRTVMSVTDVRDAANDAEIALQLPTFTPHETSQTISGVVEPFMLGVLLSDAVRHYDGNLRFPTVSEADVTWLSEKLPEGVVFEAADEGGYVLGGDEEAVDGLHDFLMGYYRNPDPLFTAKIVERQKLLEGFIVLNASPSSDGGGKIRVKNVVVAHIIRDLTRSLGGHSTVYTMTDHRGVVGVYLPAKYKIFGNEHRISESKFNRRITWVEELDEVTATQCISIDDPEHLYVTDNYIPTHNTLVSVCTLMMGLEGGFQGALMAPTEILAQQLYTEVKERTHGVTLPGGVPVTVEYLGGKTRVAERRRILAGLLDGSVHILVGTHALITDQVEFRNLGVVVIDEQHRFGVEQRALLKNKGINGAPDVLVMTATPIPRTAALTVYGDLDISVLNELPPGRTPIETTWLNMPVTLTGTPHNPGAPWGEVRAQVAAGRQAYVVASLVEDNETIAAASAEETYNVLAAGPLKGLRIGMVHGKQKRELRDETMLSFKNGDLDVLVATTVIEVGVNVPNATIMVVLDASRFGIAQLHQIRGRVGRGVHASSCVLVGKPTSADGVTRMKALCDSTDGFYLSEVDLKLRGEGTVFSTNQSGLSDLKVANLQRDVDLIALAKNEVAEMMDGDPQLLRRPQLKAEVMAMLGEDAAEWLSKS